METTLKIVGIGFCAVLLSLGLKKTKPEYSLLISIAFALTVCTLALRYLSKIITEMSQLFKQTGLDIMYWEILMKAVGIAFITQIGSSICEDAGEKAIATKIELIGQIIILVYAVPVISAIFDLLVGLMEKV